jgi:phospholipase C
MPTPPSGGPGGVSRRDLLRSLGFAGAAAALAGPAARWAGTADGAHQLVSQAAATAPAGSDIGAIEHIVFLMMENRSYDHFFGAYPKGRGFDDHPAGSLGVFAQSYPGGTGLNPPDVLLPFHLLRSDGEECTDDLTHDWGPQHLCWNGGKMDSFVTTHTSSAYEGANGTMTMGYYTRSDLPFYYALADAFTLCDRYHCSILGPTHPNRLMANSGTIDPAGTHGGPVTDTNATPDVLWNCTWPTMQEVLQDAGVPWKVYHPSNAGLPAAYGSLANYVTWAPGLYNPITNPEVMGATDHVLPYFSAFRKPASALYANAFNPTFPGTFTSDVASGSLPSVSWIIPPLGFDDHPSASPDHGQFFVSMVLKALTANPAVWSKTALFLMYDENDGWFDHVPPPTAPAGTAGEYLTASPSSILEPSHSSKDLGIAGPLGLGIRVPCLVISPFSRGGHVVCDVFDHTSQLKLVAERFGVGVPNVSAWRKATVGDLTSTLGATANTSVPALPSPPTPSFTLSGSCSTLSQDTDSGGAPPDVPANQAMPTQEGTTIPASRYHLTALRPAGDPAAQVPRRPGPGAAPEVLTDAARPGGRPVTTKSAYNRLAYTRPE